MSRVIDIVLLKFDPNGSRRWTRFFGTGAEDMPYGISLDALENLYLAVWTRASLEGQKPSRFGGLFLLKYDKDGSRRWTRIWGTGESEMA